MARDKPVRKTNESTDKDDPLPNLVTIVGRGIPSNFELTVDGELEIVEDSSPDEGTVVSGSSAEGTVDVGITRLRFSGELANVRVVDWNGIEAADSPSTPAVHIDYGLSH